MILIGHESIVAFEPPMLGHGLRIPVRPRAEFSVTPPLGRGIGEAQRLPVGFVRACGHLKGRQFPDVRARERSARGLLTPDSRRTSSAAGRAAARAGGASACGAPGGTAAARRRDAAARPPLLQGCRLVPGCLRSNRMSCHPTTKSQNHPHRLRRPPDLLGCRLGSCCHRLKQMFGYPTTNHPGWRYCLLLLRLRSRTFHRCSRCLPRRCWKKYFHCTPPRTPQR
jgi:hypothetical protein